ncbi:hypothetical protein Clacol_007680 [Clathrus columnatus]|uniref:Uncharacterized protein n=1 Tax=Clathrus columnatus TaxID=1419009 RepID=A0AAV5AFK4_9AGAM|nr:hypothetical protein Clacol_007680 [Clathrus columnatus]
MDPSWCPGCDRLILPKRFLVPVNPPASDNQPSQQQSPPPPPPPPASTPVPSSPQVRKKHTHQPKRLGGGLLQGTGRVRPGVPLKSSAGSNTTKSDTSSPAKKETQNNTQQQRSQRKSRVVISQDPTPLYCSEECRLRDLKNSFIESESAGFAGAPAALNHIAKLEHIQQLEKSLQSQRNTSRRHSSMVSPTLSQSPTDSCSSGPSTSSPHCPPPSQQQQPQPAAPSTSAPKPKIKPIFRTSSYTSTSTTSSSTNKGQQQPPTRPAARRNSSTSSLLSRGMPSWGSPTKAALAPPATSRYTACSSSCSLDSTTATSVSMSLSMSSLFEDSPTLALARQSLDTEGTTPPSGSGSGSGSDDKKKLNNKAKRVSFAGDSKPISESPEEDTKIPSTSTSVTQMASRTGSSSNVNNSGNDTTTTTTTTTNTRRRTPPYFEALSLSPKDRVRPSSLPVAPATTANNTTATTTQQQSVCPPAVSHSSPAIALLPTRGAGIRKSASAIYKVAMWPEDEKRTTESAKVHGELLRGYAKRFGPREGRSLVWSQLWVSADRASSPTSTGTRDKSPTSPITINNTAAAAVATTRPSILTNSDHEAHSDSDTSYWAQWESQQAAVRARRKAEDAVARLEEERVIGELLDGAGMREEDQPQARRMRRMAYDGMPGPAELRGLTYRFDRFLYDLGDFTQEPCDGQTCMPVPVQEKKRLFNFED